MDGRFRMNSRLAYRRLRASLIGVAAAAAIAPSGAGAATTVGSTFNPGTCWDSDISLLQTASPPANSYAVPSDGVLTAWSYQAAGQTPDVKLKVARATANADDFFIVGESAVKTAVASITNTYDEISIPVQAGDFLGLRIAANGACGDINPAAGYVSRYTGTDLVPDTTFGIPALAADDTRLDISASLEADADGDGLGDETEDADDDGDGVPDASDNCNVLENPDQADLDGDDQGDACDADDDGDTVVDASDNCARVANPDQADLDGDALGDACDDGDGDDVTDAADNCVSVANPDQANLDGDAQGDACDADDDGDGATDASDNCPSIANATQANADGDAQGDACDGTPGAGPGPGPGIDTTKPVLSVLSMSSSVFQAAGSGPAFAAKVGTTVSFSVSEASSVRFTVQRKTKGRRVAGSCKRQTRANRTKKRCTRWVSVKGSFSIAAAAGATSFTFRGRIGDRKLRPGSYRLNSRATDAANNKSGTTRKTFRIVK
jgi:hypothetical protein